VVCLFFHQKALYLYIIHMLHILTENLTLKQCPCCLLADCFGDATSVVHFSFNPSIIEGDTPLLVRGIKGGFRRYEVRKESVRSTQNSCYIVRRHNLLLKILFLRRNTTKLTYIQSKFFAKTRKSNKQTHQS